MGGYRGIDPTGLIELAAEVDHRGRSVDAAARTASPILHRVSPSDAGGFSEQVRSVLGWTDLETENLRWRADAITEGQQLDYGMGIPDIYIDEVRDRALIATFVPSTYHLEQAYQQWVVIKARMAGRELGSRYLTGEDVSAELDAYRHRANYESVAAAFFNKIGDESTAYLPQNVQMLVWRGSLDRSDADAIMLRFAHAFAAATRSDELEFTVDELFTRDDPLAELNDKYAAALLFTQPGIAADWLLPAAARVAVGQPYIPWITSPEVVVAVLTGLVNNPDVAANALAEPDAVEYLLRRSTFLDDAGGHLIGDVLVVAATEADDAVAAAQTAGAMVAALGGGDVHPRDEILPYVALVTGSCMDELAWSLSDPVDDPTYTPRFEVSRATARVLVGEVVRNTEAYAILLAATEIWIRDIVVPANATTFEQYTAWMQNKTDDVGRLLGALVSADQIIALGDAEERARRQAMLLDSVKALAQVGAEFAGPAKVVMGPSVDFVRNRAEELLGNDYLRDAYYENQQFQEEVLDELDRVLFEVIQELDLVSEVGELSPERLALEEGAVRSLIRTLIAAELLAYSVGDFRPDD